MMHLLVSNFLALGLSKLNQLNVRAYRMEYYQVSGKNIGSDADALGLMIYLMQCVLEYPVQFYT